MDVNEIIHRLEKIAKHAVHCVGEPILVLSLDDGIALNEAAELLKEQEQKHVLQDRTCETRPFHYVRKGYCPRCHQEILWTLNRAYCGFCGQKVKWNDYSTND